MTRPNLISQVSALTPRRRGVVVAVLVVVAFLLAVIFALDQAGEFALAWWWPAAGVASAAVLCTPRRYAPVTIVLVALLTMTATGIAGRPPAIVVAGGVGTAAQLAVMWLGLTRGGTIPRLATTRDVGRFLGTAAVAAASLAVVFSLAAVPSGIEFLPRFLSTTASHLSALLLIVPLVLIDRSRQRVSPWWHTTLMTFAIVVAVVVAFGPVGNAPLAFLPVPLLAWAASSESMFLTVGHVLLAIVLAGAFTVAGSGQFVSTNGLLGAAALLQIYAVAVSATCLLIAAQRVERQELEDSRAAFGRLLRDSFARSRSGFAIIQQADDGALTVMQANGVAGDLLGPQLVADASSGWAVAAGSPFERLLGGADHVRTHESSELGGLLPASRFWIDPITRPGLGRVLLVTVEDLRPVRAVEQAMSAQLERERGISDALRDLTDKQDAFVASVSHELRTPITSIVGYAQELDEELDDPLLREYVAVITRNADRLGGLVDNALRTASSTPPIGARAAGTLDLARLVRDCVADLRHQIDARGLHVSESDTGQNAAVRADASELGQIVSNLLTNAIKFSPVGGELGVAVSASAHHATLEITDDGPGIAESERARVFERFYRSAQATREGVAGTGIGLAVAQTLAGAMGGSIVLSGHDTAGTRATLRLPRADPSPVVSAP
ncbi:ATP-binding protein [Microbacterium sp. NPDC089189]|uniref:sensor histidine kinase n=1 Tax=Microbacterium sp. NPDC089189 TaxID=3154972 RepID=UPI00343143BE